MTTTLPVVSVTPVVLSAPRRGNDPHVRVTAPAAGTDLPVLVFSHGYHQSSAGYDPLVDAWASHFVVIQPTHLDSQTLDLPADDPRTPDIWRIRREDLTHVLDQLETAVAAVPGLAERVDLSRVALVGHSWGGQTVGMLLGAGVLDPDGTPGESYADPRVSAGVLLTTTGAGDSLTSFAAENFSFMRPNFASLTTRTLVVAGDADQSMLSSRGPEWFTDAYVLSPGATDLVTVFGGEHSLSGITGYGVTETTDENPERVTMVAKLTTAWLRTALLGDDTWATAGADLEGLGRVNTKITR